MFDRIKKGVKRFIIPSLASGMILSSAYADELLRNALVLDFENLGEGNTGLVKQIPGALEYRLDNSKSFSIIRRSEVSRSLNDPNLDESDLEKIKKIYPDLDYIISGDYGVVNNLLIISSEIVDVRNGRSASQRYEGSLEHFLKAVNALVNEMKEDLGYTPKPDKDQDSKDYDVGDKKDDGVKRELKNKRNDGKEIREYWSFMPMMEISFPLSPDRFKDLYKNAFSFGGEIKKIKGQRFGITFPYVALRTHTLDSDGIIKELGVSSFDIEGGTVKFLELGAGVTYYFSPAGSEILPFLMTGFGYSRGKEDTTLLTAPGLESTNLTEGGKGDGWYVLFKGGLEKRLTDDFSILASSGYQHTHIGDNFNLFTLSAGVGLHF